LGIEKDKPFNPTVYQIKVLEDGAKTGEMVIPPEMSGVQK
jgi:hypothetical protein